MCNNWEKARPVNLQEMNGHKGTVTCLQLFKGDRLVSGSDDGSLVLWDLHSSFSNLPSPLQSSSRVSISSSDGKEWDEEEEKEPDSSDYSNPPPALALHQLVDGSSSDKKKESPPSKAGAELVKSKGRDVNKIRSFFGHGGPVWCLDVDDEGDCLLSGSYDRTIKIWDLGSGNCLGTLRGHEGWISAIKLIPENRRVASVSWDASLRIWSGGLVVGNFSAGVGNALHCVSLGDENKVGVGCRHSQIQIWDVSMGSMVDQLMGHSKDVYSLQTLNSLMVSGSGDCSIKIWDERSGGCNQTLLGHEHAVMCVKVDGFNIVSGSYDKSVKVNLSSSFY